MIKYLLTACLLPATTLLTAQNLHIPVGKKFQVVTDNISTTSVVVMEQTIDNEMHMTSTQDYTLKSVRPTGYTLETVIRRIKGTISVMGQTQNFDSDDQSMKTSPMAAMLTGIGKPSDIKVDSGKVIMEGEAAQKAMSVMGGGSDLLNQSMIYFFQSPMKDPKLGDNWADSSIGDKIKIVNQYTVTSITPKEIELRLTSDTKMSMSIKQGNMEVQSDMKAFSTATLLYDRVSGLLISEKVASESTGTAETMGMKAPMTIKSNILITVK